MQDIDIYASVRDMADPKSKEALKRHKSYPHELPLANHSLLNSENPTEDFEENDS